MSKVDYSSENYKRGIIDYSVTCEKIAMTYPVEIRKYLQEMLDKADKVCKNNY